MFLSFCGAAGKLRARVTVEVVSVHEIKHKSEE